MGYKPPSTAAQAAQIIKILTVVKYIVLVAPAIMVVLSQLQILKMFQELPEPLKLIMPFLLVGVGISNFLIIRLLALPKARKDLEKLSGAEKGYKE